MSELAFEQMSLDMLVSVIQLLECTSFNSVLLNLTLNGSEEKFRLLNSTCRFFFTFAQICYTLFSGLQFYSQKFALSFFACFRHHFPENKNP